MANVKDYPPYLDYPKPRKIQTNGDWIRSMTNKELAQFFGHARLCDRMDEVWCRGHDGLCENCLEEWLQQPVED